MKIVRPTGEHLASYRSALVRSISLGIAAHPLEAEDELLEINEDPEAFLAKQEDRQALSGDVKLPDGSFVPRSLFIEKA